MQALAHKQPTQRERRQLNAMEASLHLDTKPSVIRQQVAGRNSKCTLLMRTPGGVESNTKDSVGTATMLQPALSVATPSRGYPVTENEQLKRNNSKTYVSHTAFCQDKVYSDNFNIINFLHWKLIISM